MMIALLKGEAYLTRREFKSFSKGDAVFGEGSEEEEIKRWPIDQKAEALQELAKYTCSYIRHSDTVDIEEYALMYFEADEDGELVSGADYDLAEENPDFPFEG